MHIIAKIDPTRDQASDEVRRQIVFPLHDAANGWRLPKVEIDAIVVGIRRGYSKARGLVESDSYTYVTAPIERGHIATVVRATGTVNPTYTVDISSQLSGRMAEVFVKFNDAVKAGQPLGRLDPEIYAAKVNEARAAMKIAQAGVQVEQAMLERARATLTTAQMARNVTEANQVGLKAKLEETQRQLDRKLTLIRSDSVSKADLSRTQAHGGWESETKFLSRSH